MFSDDIILRYVADRWQTWTAKNIYSSTITNKISLIVVWPKSNNFWMMKKTCLAGLMRQFPRSANGRCAEVWETHAQPQAQGGHRRVFHEIDHPAIGDPQKNPQKCVRRWSHLKSTCSCASRRRPRGYDWWVLKELEDLLFFVQWEFQPTPWTFGRNGMASKSDSASFERYDQFGPGYSLRCQGGQPQRGQQDPALRKGDRGYPSDDPSSWLSQPAAFWILRRCFLEYAAWWIVAGWMAFIPCLRGS